MKTVIHDLSGEEFDGLFPNRGDDIKIISPTEGIRKCVGCFGCWIRTPGRCLIHDGFDALGKLYAESQELVIISRVCYGGFSPFVKNVLDRSIGYISPYFTIRHNEMHHARRYPNPLKLSVIAYGEDLTQREKDTLTDIVKANGINLDTEEPSVAVAESVKDISQVRRAL